MVRPLTFAPRPYADEALSSWLDRIAARYGARRAHLLDYLGIDCADPDWDLQSTQIEVLATAARLSAASVRQLAHRARKLGFTSTDLLEWDPEFAVRGAVCGECLAADAAEGRDHYVRASWLSVWRISCPAHRRQLQDCEAIYADTIDAGRKVRLASRFDEVLHPVATRRLTAMRPGGRNAPAPHLLALEQYLAGGTAVTAIADPSVWSAQMSTAQVRTVTRDLCASLLRRQDHGGGFLVDLFRDPDDERPGRGSLFTPRRDPLNALEANWRADVLSAAAAILLKPSRFALRSLHGQGCRYFFELQGISSASANRMAELMRLASQDPLSLLFLVGSITEIRRLAQCATAWPAGLRARAQAAANVALAAYGHA